MLLTDLLLCKPVFDKLILVVSFCMLVTITVVFRTSLCEARSTGHFMLTLVVV